MHRCYIPPDAWGDGVLRPDAEEAHHLTHVLRVREGDAITVFDGCGRRVQAVVTRAAGGSRAVPFAFTPIPGTEQQQPTPFPLALYQSIIKGNRMDMLIEKAAELGATVIVPVVTERTVVRLAAAQAEERRERWQRIAVGAAKQCGEDWVPTVAPVVTLAAALREAGRTALCLVGALLPGVSPLREVVDARRASGGFEAAACLVGPEGDFTEAEYGACLEAGAIPVRLGPRVLRAETAAFYMLSALTALR
ncbi:MAG: 16S rRNA (uracil(1498)-N(3))-methyltransferase [Lentisphaerae bacterium]|nr:16S rRNA (uracil(1498)-N(3))-methyltransferase [Lentisphaerota bacterium]